MRVLRARCARAPLTSVTSGPGPGDHGRHCVHGAPGKAEPAAVTAITAPVVGPCPPYERDKREGSVTADPPGGHDGHGRNCPLGHRAGVAIRNIYYSDRQLPPENDPGADSGEAPNGRQRGHGH
jgi:hypothetical protein